MKGLGDPGVSGTWPFSNCMGKVVSGWAQQVVQGQQLADRVHWLQSMRADEMSQRTRWMDQPGRPSAFDRGGGPRPNPEGRGENRNYERPLPLWIEGLQRVPLNAYHPPPETHRAPPA